MKSSDVISGILFQNKGLLLSGNTSNTTPGDYCFHYIFYHIYSEFCFCHLYYIFDIHYCTLNGRKHVVDFKIKHFPSVHGCGDEHICGDCNFL